MTLKPGMFWPLVLIDVGVGLVGTLLALGWGTLTRRQMGRDTVLFICKMFGGLSLVFLLFMFLSR